VSVYSNIVILSTSALLVGDLVPTHAQIDCSLAPPVLRVGLPAKRSSSAVPSGFLISPQQISGSHRSTASGSVTQSSAAISDPPFLRRPIPFDSHSLELTHAGRNMLKRAADWLRQHREARILIVGSCDSGGSDTCTHALAEGRGAAVRKFLEGSGIDSDQIVGVKAWDNLDQSCRTSDVECQQFNRTARIFLAGSVAH